MVVADDGGAEGDGAVRLIEEEGAQPIEAVTEEGVCLSIVRLFGDGALAGAPFSGGEGKGESDGQDAHHLGDAAGIDDVGVFEIEAAGLEGGKQGLDCPSSPVDGKGGIGIGVCGHDEQFAAVEPEGGERDGRPLVGFSLAEHALAGEAAFVAFGERSKQRPDLADVAAFAERADMTAFLDAQEEGNAPLCQKAHEGCGGEFAVGNQAGDGGRSEGGAKPLEECLALILGRIAGSVHDRPEKRNGNLARDRRQGENVDVAAPELPVGAVEDEQPWRLAKPRQPGDQACQVAVAQPDLFEEALQATVVRGDLGMAGKARRQMAQIHRARDQDARNQDAKAFQPALPQAKMRR